VGVPFIDIVVGNEVLAKVHPVQLLRCDLNKTAGIRLCVVKKVEHCPHMRETELRVELVVSFHLRFFHPRRGHYEVFLLAPALV